MILNYKDIMSVDISFFKKDFTFDNTHHLARESGEHYKLLKYISDQFNNILILDVGTNWGESCVSLAQNFSNKVITYDVESRWSSVNEAKKNMPFLKNYPNIEFKLLDINKEDIDIIKSAKIIFLDIAHDGIQEKRFTDTLSEIGYDGYLICDDINAPFYPMMNPWWNSISINKYDVSEVGHTWGTGIVNYTGNPISIIK